MSLRGGYSKFKLHYKNIAALKKNPLALGPLLRKAPVSKNSF